MLYIVCEYFIQNYDMLYVGIFYLWIYTVGTDEF